MAIKEYTVSGVVTISIHTKVYASSAEAALELAGERGMVGLCHQCGGSREVKDCWVTGGELDGTPSDLKVDVK